MTVDTTIVVNVHNGARYVGECIDSILALQGPWAFKVLIVDDASTDSTADILRRYHDSRIEIVSFPKNVGAAAAINCAFGRVRSEFVARIDYDDRYHPNFLLDSIQALRRYPQAAFVCSAVRMIDSRGEGSAITGPAKYNQEPGCRDRFVSMLESHFVTAPTILGRTSHWLRAIPIPVGMNFCDWYMNLAMAETMPVAVIDGVTADYRIHPLNMHVTKVRDGMGERVTFQVLERFLHNSPRQAELASHVAAIMALHYADWGNKYFGVGMDADALRCYRAALRLDKTQYWKGRFLHRYLGLCVGRSMYDRTKRLIRPSAPL
jgi:glycosyltransferase involved in cell wall biosynthesis